MKRNSIEANPGKVNMASAGSGAASHMTGELFKMMAGVNMRHVPYRGGGPALLDLIGGQVQVYFVAFSRDLNTVYFTRTFWCQRANLLFAINSTAPAKSATTPPSNCWLVAPASISNDTIIASSGTNAPNGMTKVAG